MKKLMYVVICIFSVIFLLIILSEILLQALPYIYRLIPVNNDVQYVYILGESSAVGIPYKKISYSKIIEEVIKDKKIDNKEIKLVHLEHVGDYLLLQYISYVLYRYLHPTHRGIMLLYIGTDYWTDKEVYSDFKRNLLLKSAVYQLLYKYFITHGNYYEQDFQFEYEKIVLLAKKFGEDVYMSTIVGNCEIPPLVNNTPTEIEEIDKLYFNKDYSQAKQLCEKYLEDEKYEDKSEFWYRLGIILREENKIKEANDALINSFASNPNPIFQNDVIRKIAKKYNAPLFDFFEKLYNSGKIIGYNFFVDTEHPNIETHIDIAYGFIDLLSKKYKFDLIKKEDLDIEKLKKNLGFNNNDMAEVYMDTIMQLIDVVDIGSTDTPVKFNEDVYLKWRKSLEELEVDNVFFHNRENIEKFLRLTSEFRKIMNAENIEDDLKEKELDSYRDEISKLYKGKYGGRNKPLAVVD